MKLLLLLISLSSFSVFGIKCNEEGKEAEVYIENDTMKVVTDTMPSSVDTSAAIMNGQPASSVDTKADTVAKSTKYGTGSGKKEAPKHDSPNQMKIDSIKKSKHKSKKE
jgi:hypothetical protein